MRVFVKTFNRPFYLDRCLRSIRAALRGVTEVIVLDDGTQQRYLPLLRKRYPTVRFVSSGADDRKYELVRSEQFDELHRSYSGYFQFWAREVGASPDSHVIVIEDDTWFIRSLSLPLLQEVCDQGVLGVKLWWGDLPKAPFATNSAPIQVGPAVTVREIAPHINSLDDMWEIWLECMMVYDTRYYTGVYESFEGSIADENGRLEAALAHITSRMEETPDIHFFRTTERCLAQGWACPGRSDPKYHEVGVKSHVFLDCLNEAWLEGRLDPTENFPYDFSDGYLSRFFARDISPAQLARYWEWRRGSVLGGCEFYLEALKGRGAIC